MPTALEEFQIQRQLTDIINNFNTTTINNSLQRQNVELNRDAVLGDLQRVFDRNQPFLGVPFSRRGLETSGIRDQSIDRQLGDFQRTFQRTSQDFTRQLNNLDISDQHAFNIQESQHADIAAFRAAERSEIASQIQAL